jgi:hypothetical protein
MEKDNAFNRFLNSDRGKQQTDVDAIRKVYDVEMKFVRKRSLWTGIGIGLLLAVLLSVLLFIGIWTNKQFIAEKAMDYIFTTYVQDLFETFPDGYVSNNQHKILPVLDDFTNAASKHKVSNHEFKQLGQQLFQALNDRELTYHEIDAILARMKDAAKGGNNFD